MSTIFKIGLDKFSAIWYNRNIRRFLGGSAKSLYPQNKTPQFFILGNNAENLFSKIFL